MWLAAIISHGKGCSWNSKELLEDWSESWADHATSYLREIEAVELDRDTLPDIGWKALGMERRSIQTAAGDLWRGALGRLADVRELVRRLRERFVETYAKVRDVAGRSLDELAEALRSADFTSLKEVNDYVRSEEREAEHSFEKERDIGIDRERGLANFER